MNVEPMILRSFTKRRRKMGTIEDIHKLTIGSLERARNGAVHEAQNAHWVELIFRLEKLVLWYILQYER